VALGLVVLDAVVAFATDAPKHNRKQRSSTVAANSPFRGGGKGKGNGIGNWQLAIGKLGAESACVRQLQ